MHFLMSSGTGHALDAAAEIIRRLAHNYFNLRSIGVLIISVALALVIGRLVAAALRKLVLIIGHQADKIEDLHTVNRLRRYETVLVLSIAIIRTALILFALYFWWMYLHPSGRATGIIGAGALAIVIISGALGPVLRDLTAGSFMMAEHWYGVGDHIKIEPFLDMQGVVERVTLRSTRIRGLNGEIMWVNNQNISGVRLAPKGLRVIGLEMFVDNLEAGRKLIDRTNKRLPIGPLLVSSPLQITSEEQVGDALWHITAVGETAPGREWLIENSAVELIKWLDEQTGKPVLAHGPLPRYADMEAERRFSRTIRNARKRPQTKRRTRNKTPAVKAKS